MLKSLLKDIYASRNRVAPPPEPAPSVAATTAFEACDRWLNDIVFRMFELMHRTEEDNFAADRYRELSPNAFYYQRHASYFVFFLRNVQGFFHTRQLLEDEASRELFDRLILYRVLGHTHVRLPFNTPANRAHPATAQSWWVEDTSDTGPFGPLAIYRVPGVDGDIKVKGWNANITWTFLYRQYFLDRGDIHIKAKPGDQVIDAGGCFGDTAIGFADVVGERGHVHVFDPLPKHCAIMRQQVAMNPALASRISIYPAGLSDSGNDVALLAEDGVINPGARVDADAMPMTTIDTIALDKLPSVDFIKMDIEGSELAALRGAEGSIRRWRPRLAISLYHRPEDFFTIPAWIDSLGVGYRFFLDHYSIHHEETVLYAMV